MCVQRICPAAAPRRPGPPLQSANGRCAGDRPCHQRRAPAVAAVARARHGGHPGLHARAPGAHAQRGGQPHRHHARDGAPHPAHAREARARALRRAPVLAHAAPADPRLGLPLVAEPLRAGAAAHGDAGRGDARVVLGRDPRPARRRLRRARAHAADHVDHAERRHAPAGALHVDGARPARRPARGRARPLPAGEPRSRRGPSARRPIPTGCAPRSTRSRQRGWALVDQELEIGLRSVAAPIRRGPETIAALNVSSAVSRVSLDDLRRRILPPLVETANTISNALTQQGPAYHRTVS